MSQVYNSNQLSEYTTSNNDNGTMTLFMFRQDVARFLLNDPLPDDRANLYTKDLFSLPASPKTYLIDESHKLRVELNQAGNFQVNNVSVITIGKRSINSSSVSYLDPDQQRVIKTMFQMFTRDFIEYVLKACSPDSLNCTKSIFGDRSDFDFAIKVCQMYLTSRKLCCEQVDKNDEFIVASLIGCRNVPARFLLSCLCRSKAVLAGLLGATDWESALEETEEFLIINRESGQHFALGFLNMKYAFKTDQCSIAVGIPQRSRNQTHFVI